MNKEELIRRISNDVGIVQEDVRPILNSLIKITGQTLAQGEPIHLVGLDTWRVQRIAPRVVKHPQTGECIPMPARRVPVFRKRQIIPTCWWGFVRLRLSWRQGF